MFLEGGFFVCSTYISVLATLLWRMKYLYKPEMHV